MPIHAFTDLAFAPAIAQSFVKYSIGRSGALSGRPALRLAFPGDLAANDFAAAPGSNRSPTLSNPGGRRNRVTSVNGFEESTRTMQSHRIFWSIVIAAFCIAARAPAHADLISNANFATGDFTGWTVAGDGIAIDSTFPNTGDTYDAVFTAVTTDPNPGVLSQSVGTTSGAGYDLSFALLDEAGFSGDTFTVTFGGFSETITGDQASPYLDGVDLYTAESVTIPDADITAGTTTLSFLALSDPISGIAWNLDDVSLTPASFTSVPEPSSLALLLTALAAACGACRWRRRRTCEAGS